MTASQLPLTAPAHRNQQLFSDHYLDHLLPQRSEWQALAAEAATAMGRIAALARGFNTAANEAQLEEDLARPILRELGHTFEVQAALQTPLGTKRPDYVLYRDEAARQALRGATLTDEALRSGGIAVGDAKAWDRPLDVAGRKGHADEVNANPSYQIAFYMQHSGLPWGILTNGRLWRLYHKDSAHKLDRFYEVDLFDLLERGDPTAFLYFYAFFRRAAFDAGPLSLEALLQTSQEYARAVGDTLKAQVYDALLHMAQGFLDHPANGLQPDPATLKQIYDNSLIVLYRLLFILYAEARELLPLRESQEYRDTYSLNAIKRRVAQDRDYGHALLPTSTRYWSQLRDLFGMIDRGSPPLRIAAFNGGLFDPQRHAFLERYSIGDARLQHAIDLLARVNREFVDYRDLAERHLGTIYEGLLEYHLEPKDESRKQKEEGLQSATSSFILHPSTFTVDLLNDKGERKATGSYYTPDYIVKYIVAQTVGPVLRRAVEGKTSDRAIIRAVLAVNVLDPAMGSGHFLVEATDYIASFLVDLGVQPDEETGGEADVAFWKRRVAQSCIYGMDLNPLAVDLAKLSLWLATVAKDRPLSFLDHHLRCGNALVGARLADLQVGSRGAGAQRKTKKPTTPEAQLALFDEEALRQSMSRAVDSMWLIEASAAHTVADVKEQEQAYQSMRADLNARYGRLADLVTATHFGLQIDQALWNPLADYATGRTIAAHQRIIDWLAEAERIAHERRFFHWELEFPEVFFDRHGQPLGEAAGFDAVVGNPPWGADVDAVEKAYLSDVYVTKKGEIETYIYMIEQSCLLLQTAGLLGYITPNTWLTQKHGEALRGEILKKHHVLSVIHLRKQIFSEVPDIVPVIFILKADSQLEKVDVMIASPDVQPPDDIIQGKFCKKHQVTTRIWKGHPQKNFNIFRSDEVNVICLKIEYTAEHLREHYRAIYGVRTGNNSLYLKNDYQSDALPCLESASEIRRYTIDWNGKYLVYADLLSKAKVSELGQEKILVQYSRKLSMPIRIMSAFDKEGKFVPLNRFSYIISLKDGPSLLYLMAIISSSTINFYHANTFIDYDIKPTYLQEHPIRRIAFTTPADERERLVAEGRAHYERGDHAALLALVSEQLPRMPDGTPNEANQRSDVVHDLLAFLAEQMIAMNRQRQDALGDLLIDLEGVLPAGALDKLGRLWTPPRTGAAADEEAMRVLGSLAAGRIALRDDIGALTEEQWKWLIRRRVKKLGSLADVVRVFRRRQPPVAALDARIAATDRLIDQIVYRLYNLTDAEIAIVEGSAASADP